MIRMDEKKLLKIALYNQQVIIKQKLKEEIMELLIALERNDDRDIIEETADVLIMINQMLIAQPENVMLIEEQIAFKLQRTIERYKIK